MMCAKYNIVYKYLHNLLNINDVLTEDGYYIFKHRYFHPFRAIVDQLENVNDHFTLDIDMVV